MVEWCKRFSSESWLEPPNMDVAVSSLTPDYSYTILYSVPLTSHAKN